MSDLTEQIKIYIHNKEFNSAFEKLNQSLDKNPENKDLLLMRGDLFYNLQHYSKALNDFNKIIRIESQNKIVSSKIEMIKDILKFQAVDIIASTNLNVDPWLDE